MFKHGVCCHVAANNFSKSSKLITNNDYTHTHTHTHKDEKLKKVKNNGLEDNTSDNRF